MKIIKELESNDYAQKLVNDNSYIHFEYEPNIPPYIIYGLTDDFKLMCKTNISSHKGDFLELNYGIRPYKCIIAANNWKEISFPISLQEMQKIINAFGKLAPFL